jgi:septal ring factor EnvC (AmiA/AmiB activator)
MTTPAKGEQPRFWRSPTAALLLIVAATVLANWPPPAAAQDIRGLEACTTEKQMDRRTGCLQANVDFLQQELTKLARQTEDKLDAADRSLAAARAEITALKTAVEKLNSELTRLKAKAEADGKK